MSVATRKRWNRQSVVEAAADLADKHGYDALTLAMLAQHMGVKPPSVYKHVQSLDDVKTGIQALAATRLTDALMAAAGGKSGDEAVFAVADAYRAFVKAHPGLQVAMSRPSATAHQGPGDDELESSNRQLLGVAVGLLGEYQLSEDDTIHALRMLRSLIHGFVMLETTGSFEMGYDLDTSYRWAIETYIRGLAGAARPTG